MYGDVLHCSEELQNTYARHLLTGKSDHSDAFVYIPFVLATIGGSERDSHDPKEAKPGQRHLPCGLEERASDRYFEAGELVLLPRRECRGAALES